MPAEKVTALSARLAQAVRQNRANEQAPTAPIDGAELLDSVCGYLQRFVAYPSQHAAIAHTHLMNEWESTPRLAFLSPEPGSGKTRALEISETVTAATSECEVRGKAESRLNNGGGQPSAEDVIDRYGDNVSGSGIGRSNSDRHAPILSRGIDGPIR